MYNVHQFISRKAQEDKEAMKQLKQQEYLLRHEEYKKIAHGNLKKKTEEFLHRELTSSNPVVIEDDHFQSWRKHRIFRDVSDENKFIGNKVFKHRPNEDMGRYYDERERREMSYLASRTQDLVKSGVIPKEHISRSLASQGPYNPKIQHRDFSKDKQCLQPRMRYSNITDQQRLNESDMLFDQRLQSIYHKFEQKKMRTGTQMKSNAYGISSQFSEAPSSNSMRTTKSMSIRKISQKGPEMPEMEAYSASSSKVSSSAHPKPKTYFQLAKMMSMFHPEHSRREQLGKLLEKAQYSRKKDLTNIRSNSYNENYQKHPVL